MNHCPVKRASRNLGLGCQPNGVLLQIFRYNGLISEEEVNKDQVTRYIILFRGGRRAQDPDSGVRIVPVSITHSFLNLYYTYSMQVLNTIVLIDLCTHTLDHLGQQTSEVYTINPYAGVVVYGVSRSLRSLDIGVYD